MKISSDTPLITVVCPAFNESENLPLMYQRLCVVLDDLNVRWEWIIVDDHSDDQTNNVLESLIEKDKRVRSVRLSRNFGSHIAILAGLRYSCGECAIIMAADLQDPPEVIPRLLERWKTGAKVVWGVREKREAESFATKLFSRLYYALLRTVTILKDTPPTGSDLWLMDRQVLDELNADPERHCSVPGVIRWMGFTQDSIYYIKAARQYGKSKWSFSKKINHAINTFVATTVVPLRFMTYLGFFIALIGFFYALFILVNAFFGYPVQGWASLMIVILMISGIQILMLGILGEYLWRTYEESRQRPRYIVEQLLNIDSAGLN